MNKAIEFVKRDKIAQILLGVVGLLFLLAIFKKKEQSLPPAPPPQAVKPEAPVVQPLPSGVSNPPSPQEAFQTLPVEKPAEKPEEKPEEKPKEENKAEKKPEGVQGKKLKKKEARKQKEERQEGRKQERGKAEVKKGKFFEGYGLVCVVGGSCVLYDSKTGETLREGSEIRGWRIEKISPQGALLRKGDEVIREDF